jgi:hypothetical protein
LRKLLTMSASEVTESSCSPAVGEGGGRERDGVNAGKSKLGFTPNQVNTGTGRQGRFAGAGALDTPRQSQTRHAIGPKALHKRHTPVTHLAQRRHTIVTILSRIWPKGVTNMPGRMLTGGA